MTDSPIKKFGENLRRERLRLKLTQAATGQKCGFHRSYISSLERGQNKVPLHTVQQIADGLGIPAWNLLVR